jgi:DNA-directed RNA polymerase subunit alpha
MSSFQFECLELHSQTPTEVFGKFVFKPVEKGHGITIGNILRRVILTNLWGLSIVGVRILGTNHEFSAIQGIREDVLEILLNLKEIIFKYQKDPRDKEENNEEKTQSFIGRFKIYGPSIVTASNLQLPPNLKLINPNQYIATVMEGGFFEMEVKLEWGKGYSLANNTGIKNSFDFISVDAIFMPVFRVNYEVEPFFLGHQELGEQLILNIWTNGSISPHQAILEASTSISNWFNEFIKQEIFLSLEKKRDLKNIEPLSKNQKHKKIQKRKKISIDKLNLSTRPYNCLKKANIKFIDDLLTYSRKDLSKIKGVGRKSLQEMIDIFKHKFNVSLK